MDSLGDRMKGYESVSKNRLARRIPVMIRLDGKAFHTFTRGMPRPYHRPFHEAMWAAATYLCENIQGAQIAYVQSDEITLLLTDYAQLDTAAWYDYQVQKMCSVAASMCTAAFNQAAERKLGPELDYKQPLAAFDCRAWNLPKEEVVNAFVWRQQDATRNAIQMAGQSNFSHKEMHGLNNDQVQEKLFQERQINFNDYPVPQKRGACIVRESYNVKVAEGDMVINGKPGSYSDYVRRTRWVVDENIPIFTQDRNYIERYLKHE
jgi:tRNA(His) guanylyltransferase